MFSRLNVGVLALQGDFERHLFRLSALKVSPREVRQKDDLSGLDGLIIPGGESTTLNLLIDRFDIRGKLAEFSAHKAVWGTCAGLIMLARQVNDPQIQTLGIIDISVVRNAYGRQVHSFYSIIEANLNGKMVPLEVSFIRAPIVKNYGNNIKVLAQYRGSPTLLSHQNCLVSSFHTELHDDLTLTKYFLENFVSVFK
ncbi:MAG: pyridoxal 5'-phosphate synthase glutaminase subunit PdxT [candidate division Zixibacteria bacterium]|nr:pyridoxal 5'-phosphate synthase glutaminase subunit PdxT [candidate division Zixibacteria bacterium]